MTAAIAFGPKELLVPQFEPEFFVTLDFETFYDQDYSLTKLGTSDYVRDPRFETIGVGVGEGGEKVWMEDAEFRQWIQTVPWDRTAVKAHHSHFEALILSHHYNIYPAFWLCTLSMSRTFGLSDGLGLDDLAEHFKVGTKDHAARIDAKGKRRRDFTHEEWLRYGDYCLTDVTLCDAIFDAMLAAEDGFPESELWLIHIITMMFARPRLFADVPLLTEYLKDEKARKQTLLDRVAKDKSLMMSGDKFANELRLVGIDPPMKPSPKRKDGHGQPLMIYAFSKSDVQMQELLEHERDEVRWLVETRLALKSTINETRTERFLRSAVAPDGSLRPLPVYLKYYGAHTGRASGSDRRNWQNLERTNKKNPKKGVLRKSALAPFKRKVVAADSGAIEARITAWLAGHEELVASFAENRDIYSEFMSQVLNRRVDRKKNPEDEIPGFIGKICVLGLGYGMGWPKLAENFLKGAMNGPSVQFGWDMAQQLGADVSRFMGDDWKMDKVDKMISRLSKEDLVVHCAVTDAIVKKYRQINKPIVELWNLMENVLEAMLEDEADYTFGPNDCLRAIRHAIVLPNGMKLRYPGLRCIGGDYTYLGEYGKMRKHVYGGAATENVVQALARVVVTDQLLHMKAVTNEDPVLFTHDELAYVPDDDQAQQFLRVLMETMKTAPSWAKGLPLSVEGGVNQSYGLCK